MGQNSFECVLRYHRASSSACLAGLDTCPWVMTLPARGHYPLYTNAAVLNPLCAMQCPLIDRGLTNGKLDCAGGDLDTGNTEGEP